MPNKIESKNEEKVIPYIIVPTYIEQSERERRKNCFKEFNSEIIPISPIKQEYQDGE